MFLVINKMREHAPFITFLLMLNIGISIQKLNFAYENNKYVIKANSGDDIVVSKLKFYTNKKPEIERNVGYHGFTRYKKGDDFGTLYLMKDDNDQANSTNSCPCRNTPHARAFLALSEEKKCPSQVVERESIIASGFCYGWAPYEDGKWGFNSRTFNSVKGVFSENTYLNRLYHDDDEKTMMHPDEQLILRYCMKEWLVKEYHECYVSNARHSPRPPVSLTCDGTKPSVGVVVTLLSGLFSYFLV